MPRRAKTKKGRLTRMDAACDHLCRMGFLEEDVRRTVKELLEVYLGEDAWVFLEEDSYRVVFEALLEKPEAGPAGPAEPLKLDYHPHEGPNGLLETCESVKEICSVGETSASHECLVEAEDAHEQERSNVESSSLLADGPSIRRRPPCYGWISEDEEEFIHTLPPSNCKKQAMVHCSLSYDRDRKRKSRWDVKPDDTQ